MRDKYALIVMLAPSVLCLLAFNEEVPLFIRGLFLGWIFGAYLSMYIYAFFRGKGKKSWFFYVSPVLMLCLLGYGVYLAIQTELSLKAMS